jgi:hypothetical protein
VAVAATETPAPLAVLAVLVAFWSSRYRSCLALRTTSLLGLAVQRRHPAARREQAPDQAVGSVQSPSLVAEAEAVQEPLSSVIPAHLEAVVRT